MGGCGCGGSSGKQERQAPEGRARPGPRHPDYYAKAKPRDWNGPERPSRPDQPKP